MTKKKPEHVQYWHDILKVILDQYLVRSMNAEPKNVEDQIYPHFSNKT